MADQKTAVTAPDEDLPPGMVDATPKVIGGAVVKDVPIIPVAPEVPESDQTVNVVTYAPGTLSAAGIVAVGTKATVNISAYSVNWMRPASKEDAAKLKKAGKALAP